MWYPGEGSVKRPKKGGAMSPEREALAAGVAGWTLAAVREAEAARRVANEAAHVGRLAAVPEVIVQQVMKGPDE